MRHRPQPAHVRAAYAGLPFPGTDRIRSRRTPPSEIERDNRERALERGDVVDCAAWIRLNLATYWSLHQENAPDE